MDRTPSKRQQINLEGDKWVCAVLAGWRLQHCLSVKSWPISNRPFSWHYIKPIGSRADFFYGRYKNIKRQKSNETTRADCTKESSIHFFFPRTRLTRTRRQILWINTWISHWYFKDWMNGYIIRPASSFIEYNLSKVECNDARNQLTANATWLKFLFSFPFFFRFHFDLNMIIQQVGLFLYLPYSILVLQKEMKSNGATNRTCTSNTQSAGSTFDPIFHLMKVNRNCGTRTLLKPLQPPLLETNMFWRFRWLGHATSSGCFTEWVTSLRMQTRDSARNQSAALN